MRTYIFVLFALVYRNLAIAAPQPTRAKLPNIWTAGCCRMKIRSRYVFASDLMQGRHVSGI